MRLRIGLVLLVCRNMRLNWDNPSELTTKSMVLYHNMIYDMKAIYRPPFSYPF